MKPHSLGPLLVASALAAAPLSAHADDAAAPAPDQVPALAAPSDPVVPAAEPAPGAAPVPAPAATPSPAAPSVAPLAPDDAGPTSPGLSSSPSPTPTPAPKGPPADVVPDVQATEPSLIGPSALEVQAVPNFFIEDFDIPPFLLPIYQAAGSEYGIRWEVLAAINRIETAYGTNLNVSSAGALGWMQFMPSTWATYGVDANGDGEKDPFNPADAIFAAARYLKAAGGDQDLRTAIYAYNHADWYVDQVMDSASHIASIPEPIISSLAALTQGIFPIDAADRSIDYRGKLKATEDQQTVAPGDDASDTVEGDSVNNAIEVTAPAGARVVAVQDGVIEKIGQSDRLGTYIRLRDAYGNRYTYAHLGDVQDKVPLPKPEKDKGDHAQTDDEGTSTKADAPTTTVDPTTSTTPAATTPSDDPAPTEPATAGTAATTPSASTDDAGTTGATSGQGRTRLAASSQDVEVSKANPAETPRRIRFRARNPVEQGEAKADPAEPTKDDARLFAHPTRPAAYAAGGEEQLNPEVPDTEGTDATADSLAEYFSIDYGLKPSDVRLHTLKEGTHVIAGTVLGRLAAGTDGSSDANLTFEIRPAGKKAPRIDPKPILDGWRLMDRTAFYKAQAKQAVEAGTAGDDLSAGQVLLMSKAELQTRVLTDKRITIYECGRRDIKAGLIDRRILALLEYLAVKGAKPSVTALECGHSLMTASGNISEHSTGTAVDIGSVYDTTVTPATQGPGTTTDRAVQEILKLQGAMKPHQIITLMQYAGTDNTLAMSDHDDHIHVGYRPDGAPTGAGAAPTELRPGQWSDLLRRLRTMRAPKVAATPSDASIAVAPTTPATR